MADPVSLVALGAAVGGAAGKFVEKAWDSGERWLQERFGSHAAETQQLARENAADFVVKLAKRVADVEAGVQNVQARGHDRHPQFSAFLQDSLIASAETDDPLKHDLLADLVATRLTASAETIFSLSAPLAAGAIRRCTRNQLKTAAVRSLIEDITPRYIKRNQPIVKVASAAIAKLGKYEFSPIDAWHLAALGAATFHQKAELGFWWYDHIPHRRMETPPLSVVTDAWTRGLFRLELTTVGKVVGMFTLKELAGVAVDLTDMQ